MEASSPDKRTLAQATSMKLQGNEAFKAGRLDDALTYYMDAQQLLLDHELDDDGLDSVLYSNSTVVLLGCLIQLLGSGFCPGGIKSPPSERIEQEVDKSRYSPMYRRSSSGLLRSAGGITQ